MFVSDARKAANARNATRSTGPRTVAGKEKSRANSLKHGLCASVIVPEDIELIQERTSEWFYTLKPQNEHQGWVVGRIAVYSIRIDRCERTERRYRDRKALNAELCWDDDRRREAEKLGGVLGKNPGPVLEELRKTPQGCDWLISRWAMLAHVADVKKAWTADQDRLAFDLLGTPDEFRVGSGPGIELDSEGRVIPGDRDPASFARRQIAELKARRDVVADLDEVDRYLVEADLVDEESDPELRKLRRYETRLHTRLNGFFRMLQYKSPHFQPNPALSREWVDRAKLDRQAEEIEAARAAEAEAPKPEPTPEPPAIDLGPAVEGPPKLERWQLPDWHPPFDLEPHECPPDGQKADIPAILEARAQAKAKKAEARRDARRRKLERLRA